MVYYTYSQGFRPGGFNRTADTCLSAGPDRERPVRDCQDYPSDELTNNEIGWKTEWFDHRLQWNGALYQENWNNVQVGFFDPGETGNLTFGTNGQNFRIRGIETSIVGRVTNGLTVQGAAWNQSEQTNSPVIDRQQPRQRQLRQGHYGGLQPPAPLARRSPICSARSGARAPIAAHSVQPARALRVDDHLQHVRAVWRYPYRPFLHAGGQQPVARTASTPRLRFENSGLLDLRCVGRRGEGCLERDVFVQNLSNSNASLFTSAINSWSRRRRCGRG